MVVPGGTIISPGLLPGATPASPPAVSSSPAPSPAAFVPIPPSPVVLVEPSPSPQVPSPPPPAPPTIVEPVSPPSVSIVDSGPVPGEFYSSVVRGLLAHLPLPCSKQPGLGRPGCVICTLADLNPAAPCRVPACLGTLLLLFQVRAAASPSDCRCKDSCCRGHLPSGCSCSCFRLRTAVEETWRRRAACMTQRQPSGAEAPHATVGVLASSTRCARSPSPGLRALLLLSFSARLHQGLLQAAVLTTNRSKPRGSGACWSMQMQAALPPPVLPTLPPWSSRSATAPVLLPSSCTKWWRRGARRRRQGPESLALLGLAFTAPATAKLAALPPTREAGAFSARAQGCDNDANQCLHAPPSCCAGCICSPAESRQRLWQRRKQGM